MAEFKLNGDYTFRVPGHFSASFGTYEDALKFKESQPADAYKGGEIVTREEAIRKSKQSMEEEAARKSAEILSAHNAHLERHETMIGSEEVRQLSFADAHEHKSELSETK